MKLITTNFKQVEYFGHQLTVPVGTRYLAMDKGGIVYAYKHEPTAHNTFKCWGIYVESLISVCLMETEMDWRDTLREV